MMRTCTTFILMLCLSFLLSYGQDYSVNSFDAQRIAEIFFTTNSTGSQLKSNACCTLVFSANDLDITKKSTSTSSLFYVFNSPSKKQFVIISGNKRGYPVLGYSTRRCFTPEKLPPNLKTWLTICKNQIEYAIAEDLPVSPGVKSQWNNFSNQRTVAFTEVVSPLIQTQWNQDGYYSELCPVDQKTGENVLGGCVAVPMAQLMKYWNYPVSASGSHSYTPVKHPEYGEQNVDFSSAVYDYSSMPNSLSTSNEQVAKLIYHCGVSVNMNYGPDESSAYLYYGTYPSVYLALPKYFGFKSSLVHRKRIKWSADDWNLQLKEDLISGRPVYYGAQLADDLSNGHAWLVDGYDNNDYFHYNFGWGGACDGYYLTEAIELEGSYSFSDDQEAIGGIEPLTSNPVSDLRYNSKISFSPSNYIAPGQALTISTEIANKGGAAFNGTFIAVWSDDSTGAVLNMVIDTLNTYSLDPGESSGEISFTFEDTRFMSDKKSVGEQEEVSLLIAGFSSEQKIQGVYEGYSEDCIYPMRTQFIISENSLSPDGNEDNNTELAAVEFPLSFENDSAEVIIQGNIHAGNDIDYYKINLPENYDYDINTYIYDNKYTGDDGIYSFDGKYSVKYGDETWGNDIDLLSPKKSYQGNGKFIYYKVEPFMEGYLGPYKLYIKLVRKSTSSTFSEQKNFSTLSCYPNPNSGSFILNGGIDWSEDNLLRVFDHKGSLVYTQDLYNRGDDSQRITLDLKAGVYFLHIQNKNQIMNQRLVILK